MWSERFKPVLALAKTISGTLVLKTRAASRGDTVSAAALFCHVMRLHLCLHVRKGFVHVCVRMRAPVHACLCTNWAHTLSCQGSVQLIFMHSMTSSLQTLLNILFPWAFHCCLVSEINMYEARRWEFLIDLCGPALLFNICLGLLVPAQWRWNNRDNLLRYLS